ncbi:hypothetical protein CJD36_017670 [Flavipsychrobacter stenotrophus]|uniref:Uncharacterized protein n=1 Tax=Flavipsychrobacter stenotrophus TaxID=2077091 RepID=A0A2S7STA8_9BACT|nr:hypothetical protein [Flavipsychrobacter stenotrophus]PQJ09756.1 hypothetical protein CJD36_017670 [Flavipsychrobacter stenotrophus]
MKKTITTKQLEVPMDALIAVADLLIENEIPHVIVATDEENDMLTVEVEYDKDQREVIHEIDDIIDDHLEDDDDEEAEEEDDDDRN